MPPNCVITARFQYIPDSAPPAAMPANEAPCPYGLCSRMAKPPASASPTPAVRTTPANKVLLQETLRMMLPLPLRRICRHGDGSDRGWQLAARHNPTFAQWGAQIVDECGAPATHGGRERR